MMTRKTIAMIAGGSAALAAVIGAAALFVAPDAPARAAQADSSSEAPQGPPPAKVVVATATETNMAPTADMPGTVVSTNDSVIAAISAGQVVWVAQVGDEVEEGAPLARLDDRNLKIARAEASAQVRRLKARLDYQESLLKRFLDLGEEAGASKAELDQMRADRDTAREDLNLAKLALERADVDLDRAVVRAPFPGRVVSREISVGEYANASARIVRLVDMRHLEVSVRAPGELTRNVSAGSEVTVRNAGETTMARVRAIVPVGDVVSRTLELRLTLPEQARWFIGSAVQVVLPSAENKTVIAVPRDALVLRAEGVSVFTIDKDNKAVRVSVETGVAAGDLIEVKGDVAPGARVVIRGGERLREGQAVEILSAGTVSAAARGV